jgi:hypothetical protein
VKRTLKKGLKVLEMVKRERNKIITIDNSLKLRTFTLYFLKKYKNKVLIIFEFITYYHHGIRWTNKIIIKLY